MDLASVVAALASVGVRVSGSTPNSSVQADSSRARPTGLAGPEPSGTINDPGQHFHTAVRRDLRIVARLAVPRSLYRYLAQHSGGLRAARKIVGQFQSTVPDSVNSALSTAIPPASRRPCPFRPEDWR